MSSSRRALANYRLVIPSPWHGAMRTSLPYLALDTPSLAVQPLRMERPVRQRLPHAVPEWVSEGSFFFITINCEPRNQNHLCRAGLGDAVLAAFANYHERCVWHCRVALLMPDHFHAIIAFPREPGIKTTISNWKRFLTRTQKICWQRDFFDHRLRNHHEAAAKKSYMLMNPVRKGLCERVEDWPWVYHPQDHPR